MTTIFHSMHISSSGLTAQRTRLNTTSSNLANIQTTRTPEGGPFRRLDPVFQTRSVGKADDPVGSKAFGVEVTRIAQDNRPARLIYDPAHPDANQAGFVAMPNINMVEEMVNLITAVRSYEANASAVKVAKEMAQAALSIGKG